jgi:hypothetical protein
LQDDETVYETFNTKHKPYLWLRRAQTHHQWLLLLLMQDDETVYETFNTKHKRRTMKVRAAAAALPASASVVMY